METHRKMKTFFFIMTLLFVQHASAQLAPVGTKWTFLWWSADGTMEWHGKSTYVITKDTLVDSTTYSKISNGFDFFLITNEDNRIYYDDKGEKLLFFDFNARQGDTIYVDYKMVYTDTILKVFPVKIDSIHYIVTPQGDSLLQYDILALWYDPSGGMWDRNSSIIEKILFGPYMGINYFSPILFPQLFESGEEFKCYEEPTGFSVRYVEDCDKVGIGEMVSKDQFVKVYPNPARNELHIETNATNNNKDWISLYDIRGQLMVVKEAREHVLTLNTEGYPNGLYYLVITRPTGEKLVKKVSIVK